MTRPTKPTNAEALRARLFEPGFKYTCAAETDVAATFRRIKDEQQAAAALKHGPKLTPIKRTA